MTPQSKVEVEDLSCMYLEWKVPRESLLQRFESITPPLLDLWAHKLTDPFNHYTIE